MKTETRVLDVDSTLQGEKVGMTIDADATAHIMSILTDLYSNPELAVIREYSTNALDSHVEAGVDRPIEITLPTPLSPFFRVKDYGLGLNADDIREIYSRYGASSKRNSNDVVGMLGLGCKSALTYTDQFTLIGVKDGVATQVSISRDEDGGGSMTIVESYETQAPSGVEIVVPVKTRNSFEGQCREFFKFWTPGTVLVNGVEPAPFEGINLTDNILMFSADYHHRQSWIVMGNVAYPVPDEYRIEFQTPESYDFQCIVAKVPIGAVNFTPSREQLMLTKKTKETLAAIKAEATEKRQTALGKTVSDAKSKPEAAEAILKAVSLGWNGTPVFEGDALPQSINPADDKGKRKHLPFVVANGVKSYGKSYSTERDLTAAIWVNALWVVGFDQSDFSPYKRKKLDKWIHENEINVTINNGNRYNRYRHFIFVKEIPAELKPWIYEDRIYQWEDIDAVKLPRPERVGTKKGVVDGRPAGSYDGYVDGKQMNVQAADIDTSKPIFYVTSKGHLDFNLVDFAAPNGYTLVYLTKNRVAKFTRDFPQAKNYLKEIKEMGEKYIEKLTDEDMLRYLIGNDYSGEALRRFDETKIDDKEMKDLILLAKGATTSEVYKVLNGLRNTFYNHLNVVDKDRWSKAKEKADWLTNTKYCLLTDLGVYDIMSCQNLDHIYLYMNAVHAAEQEN